MVAHQAFLFLIFIANGIIIGILFDLFRILRKAFKTSDIITYIEDVLFWVLTGMIILYSIFIFNNGEIRLFMFLAIVIGIILYILLFSSYFIKVNITFIDFIKRIVLKIFQIFSIPFKFCYNIIRKIFLKPISFLIINARKGCKNLFHKLIHLPNMQIKNQK